MPTLDIPLDQPLITWPQSGRLAILDLEFTAWEGSWQRGWSEPWEWREIVQIGLLIVDAAQAYSMIEGTEVMVQPQRNPLLSMYFQKLTGITQAQLDSKGIYFSDALAQIQPYLDRVDCVIFNGQDGQILRENCNFNGIPFPWPTLQMFNFRPLLAKALGVAPADLVSSTLPALAGLTNFGNPHTALDDCRAIAMSLATWRQASMI